MVRIAVLMVVMSLLPMATFQAGSASADTSSSTIVQKSEEVLHSFKGYLLTKKKEAVSHGETLLKKIDKEIAVLETKAADASGSAKAAYAQQIKNLKQKRTVVAGKLTDLRNASEDSWDSAKEGFAEAYKALYEAYKEALAKFE